MTRGALLASVATLAALLFPPAARAGTFEVLACDAAPGFVNNSWRPDVNHGGVVAFSACPSGDQIMKGLGARTGFPYPSGWTVPTGSAARWIFDTTPGTAIVGYRANGFFEQRNHRWQVGLSNGATLLEGCPWTARDTGGACGARLYVGEYNPIPASSVLYTEVFCGSGPCPVGGGGWYGWASLTYVAVTVLDETRPSISNPAGDLWSERWVSGTRAVSFDAFDNTGIRDVRVLIDGREMARAGRTCDPTPKTCPEWPGAALNVATGNGIADGEHELTLEAIDRGDNRTSVGRKVRIDNTAPAAPSDLAVAGGDGWRSSNEFTVRWRNPEQDAAPIAGAEFRLCPASGPEGACVTGSRHWRDLSALEQLEVPRPGDWTLTVWLRDEAGNTRPETAAAPVSLRFDPDPPWLAIEAQDPEDPARVSVESGDAISGVARGEIEFRRQGSDAWRTVPAELGTGGFSATLDDEHLGDGIYELRARAWDAAGNERSTDRRTTGELARVAVPLRVKTSMRVGKKRTLRARGARRGKRVVYLQRPLVGQGRRVRLRGRLTAPGGNPLAGVDVEVGARLAIPGVDFQPVAPLRTSASGRFSYLVPAGPSRILRFRYPGGAKIRPQTREIHVRVRGSSTIRANRRRVVNGEPVTFTGRLRGGFLPGSGKLVELQFFDRGKWRTFRTLRAASSSGRWSYTYRFDGTRGTRTYRFRLRIPTENAYPFSTGQSRRVAVTVRGL